MSQPVQHIGIAPEAIIALAKSVGYEERRESVSSTLFFIESNPIDGTSPCLVNIYYTTRSIMTLLNHPSSSTNQLWRSNAYDTLEELKDLLEHPRMHTGKGYRNAQKAVRGCVTCGMMKTKGEFSKNQWAKGPDANRCNDCLAVVNVKEETLTGPWDTSTLTSGLENLNIADDNSTQSFPTLTQDLLKKHDKKVDKQQNGNKRGAGAHGGLVRRQFNCPDCPNHGRGTFIFFKKVPALKPICKCPRCKKASRGQCKRLYPVPKEAEKGYGLFKCTQCHDKWGSSRAVANIGQECFSCAKKGERIFVTPFRLERHKKKNPAGNRGMMRVPREPIGEDQVDERGYGDNDRVRNESGGGYEAGGYQAGGADSYSYEPRERVFDADSISSKGTNTPVGMTSRIPSGYKHKCAGCASGACKSRKIPFSETHDVSDGNTVSTRGSVVTNSSIDKTDFFDRDEDFSGIDNERVDGDWVEA